MKNDINNLIDVYENALSELQEMLAEGADSSSMRLKKLDRTLSEAFETLMTVELHNKASHLRRLNFLVSCLEKMNEQSETTVRMLAKIRDDANATTKYDKNFPINVVPLRKSLDGTSDALVELGYTSRSVNGFSDNQLNELCNYAVRFNEQNGITGALFYNPNTHAIFQILEGPEAKLLNLMASIEEDTRHTDVRLCFLNTITERNFENWAMSKTTLADIMTEVSDAADIERWFASKFSLNDNIEFSARHSWMIEKIRKHYELAI